jgi:hypothetical protein
MQFAQRSPHYVAGKMSIGKHVWNGKRRGSEHESKKDQAADPHDKRQQHEKTKKGHDGGLYADNGDYRTVADLRAAPIRLSHAGKEGRF